MPFKARGKLLAEPVRTARQSAQTGVQTGVETDARMGTNLPEYSVSELSGAIRRTLESAQP